MNKQTTIKGNSVEEIWQELDDQVNNSSDPFDIDLLIELEGRTIEIMVEIDLGGGFESGYEFTVIKSQLNSNPDFRFAIHQEHFIDEIGKFFGMQDVVLGYKEFDEKFIVKTDDKAKTRKLFSSADIRQFLNKQEDFTFGVTAHHIGSEQNKSPFLELRIERGVTETPLLKEWFNAFYSVLKMINQ